MACADMSASRTGALIIFERDNPVDEQIRTGTIVDAQVTAELLKNIFYPKAPLHDGAAIIRNGRIQAAGCMLPLSSNPNLSRELGMRHRAGIGMSEASDALVVIVSEETGAISVAEGGMLKRHLSKETFEKILRTGLITEEEKTGFQRFRKKKKEG
jgi:diadenylate cyclase